VALGEVFQDGWTIVANSHQLESLRLESLFCFSQLHELRFAEGSPIGGAEEKDNRTLRTFQCLVGLFPAELIGKNKCRSLLSNLQAHGRSNGVVGRWVFLPTRKTKDSNKEKHGNHNFHFCPRFGLVAYLPPGKPTSKHNRFSEANSKGAPIPLPTLFPHPPPGRSPRPADSVGSWR
jgi:hypothetical protein